MFYPVADPWRFLLIETASIGRLQTDSALVLREGRWQQLNAEGPGPRGFGAGAATVDAYKTLDHVG